MNLRAGVVLNNAMFEFNDNIYTAQLDRFCGQKHLLYQQLLPNELVPRGFALNTPTGVVAFVPGPYEVENGRAVYVFVDMLGSAPYKVRLVNSRPTAMGLKATH